MTDRVSVLVRFGSGARARALAPGRPAPVAGDDRPESAVVLVRCAFCGTLVPADAAVTFTTHDDDHYGRTELWYASAHRGRCTGCQAPFAVELSYTLTRYAGSGRADFAVDPGRTDAGADGQAALVPEADLLAAAGVEPAEPDWLTCLDVRADGALLAVGRQDGTVIVADVATGRPWWSRRPHTGRVSSVVLDGALLWSAAFDGLVVASDLESGEPLQRIETGHGRVLALRAAGADRLVTAGDDGHARMWDRSGGTVVQVLDETRFGPAYSVVVTPDWTAIGYRDGHVGVWVPVDGSPGTWQYDGHFEPPGRRGSPVHAAAVSPDGRLAAFAREGAVLLCAPGTWQRVAQLSTDLACNDLQFGPGSDELIGAGSDCQVRRWRRDTAGWDTFGERFGPALGGRPWSQDMIYSAARLIGDQILATSFDGTVQAFRARDQFTPPRTARLGLDRSPGWSSDARPSP